MAMQNLRLPAGLPVPNGVREENEEGGQRTEMLTPVRTRRLNGSEAIPMTPTAQSTVFVEEHIPPNAVMTPSAPDVMQRQVAELQRELQREREIREQRERELEEEREKARQKEQRAQSEHQRDLKEAIKWNDYMMMFEDMPRDDEHWRAWEKWEKEWYEWKEDEKKEDRFDGEMLGGWYERRWEDGTRTKEMGMRILGRRNQERMRPGRIGTHGMT